MPTRISVFGTRENLHACYDNAGCLAVHTIRLLEERLGLGLLTRTTRSVMPTNAGDYLIRSIGSHFGQIETQIVFLGQYGISRVA